MKKIYLAILGFFIFVQNASSQCTLSLDSIKLDTIQSTCNHLFFNYYATGGTPTSFHWDYGDGNWCTCLHPKNAYNKNGTYQLCGIIKDSKGCSDTLCTTVKVSCPDPCTLSEIGIHSYDSLSYSCKEYEFNTITSNNAKKIKWDFGDGDSSDQKFIVHTYKKNGTFKVKLTIQDSIGCGDTAELTVKVDCPPDPQPCTFTIFKMDIFTISGCKHKNFMLTTNKTPKTVSWDYGDGAKDVGSSRSSLHTYTDTGIFDVCVIATDSAGCKDTVCVPVKVSCPKPNVSVNGFDVQGLELYPNPVNDALSITCTSSYDIVIYDALMREVYSGTLAEGINTIDMATVTPGTYMIRIGNTSSVAWYRISKQD